jgi:hypothetical protein
MTFYGVSSFDSTSIVDSQGPGLVAAGVTYSGAELQWDAPGYYNAVSNEVLFNGASITLTFATPTDAFGLNVRDFAGYSATMTMTIYAPDNVTVLNTYTGISIGDPATFVGYQYSGGIGEVTLTNNANGWSPIISSLTFAPIPEPPPVALMACGLATLLGVSGRRRIFRPASRR